MSSGRSHDVAPPPGSQNRRVIDHPILGELPAARDVTFTLDGRKLTGRAGETIAAALVANGINTFRTMPDTGEPRGVFCGVGRCTDCLMTVDGELNVRACVVLAREGQQIKTQQGLGSWDEVAS